MSIDSKLFLHDSDKAAMTALKIIPGFTQIMKAFMKVWNEQQFKIINMSTNLKLDEGQMKKYYDILPPICEKLGIDIPELYVTLDVNPNAYTYGDTNPFIVLTSGLFETIPDELIPTVIAHECGHIACHHTLYNTMGRLILNGASTFVSGLGNIALYPIQLAFAYWMRCGEFSADRAAAICDGNSEKVIEMCMRFAGYDKDIMAEANVDLFMKQALEYREIVNGNAWNKSLEFILFQNLDHPLNAVRAYEGKEWTDTERFKNIMDYLNSSPETANKQLPVQINPPKYIGKNCNDIQTELMSKGFENIEMNRVMETDSKNKTGSIVSIMINGKDDCKEDFYKCESSIAIVYFEPKSDEEIALEHPDEIFVEEGHKHFLGRNVEEVKDELLCMGFSTIENKEMAIPKFGLGIKENNVAKIIINDQSSFDKKSWFSKDSFVVLYYYISVS